MLTIHHLGYSQSERIIWLCEELGVPYNLQLHKRDPFFSPASLKNIPGNDIGTAPVIQDGDVTLAESGAIVDWIIHKHGNGRLAPKPADANYAQYLTWVHFANGTLQPAIGRIITLRSAAADPEGTVTKRTWERLGVILKSMDHRLKSSKYLAGDDLTAADIMTVFSLSTMRYFVPFDLHSYPNIVRYLKIVSEREAYQRAMTKGDEGMTLLMTGGGPEISFQEMVKRRAEQTQSKLS